MTKQTSWHIGRASDETAIYGDHGEHIATLPNMLPKDEIISNARLISSAPDLLESLELAQRIIFQTCAVKASSPEYGIICAAIAKAKGE